MRNKASTVLRHALLLACALVAWSLLGGFAHAHRGEHAGRPHVEEPAPAAAPVAIHQAETTVKPDDGRGRHVCTQLCCSMLSPCCQAMTAAADAYRPPARPWRAARPQGAPTLGSAVLERPPEPPQSLF